MTFHIKLWLVPEPLRITFDKIDGFFRIYDGTRYLILFGSEIYGALALKNMILFTTELDIF